MEKLLTNLIGNAGEHYVAFELSRRGVSSAMLSVNTKGADILATISGKYVVSIQVKASAGSNDPRTWAVGRKPPTPSPNFYFVFLNIWCDLSKPIESFIVPSQVVLILSIGKPLCLNIELNRKLLVCTVIIGT